MYEYSLLKSQRNQVLELIKSMGMDPFNFTWSTTDSCKEIETSVPLLEYGDGEYYFQFDMWGDDKYSAYSPGQDGIDETKLPGDWDGQLNNVAIWLGCLKREVEEPDLWSDLEKYRIEEDKDVLSHVINEPFTANQAEQIQIGLLKVRSHLEQFTKDNKSQSDFVNSQLEYLADAAKRQGKRDWLHTSIGVIMTITTALALAPDEAKNIWNILKATIGGIVQLPH